MLRRVDRECARAKDASHAGGRVVTHSPDSPSRSLRRDGCVAGGNYGASTCLSQRRPLDPARHRTSQERFHDFERTMQLNYFGCLRTTMGLLPGMAAKRKGHWSTSRRSAC